MVSRKVRVINETGLHLKPAAYFCKEAGDVFFRKHNCQCKERSLGPLRLREVRR